MPSNRSSPSAPCSLQVDTGSARTRSGSPPARRGALPPTTASADAGTHPSRPRRAPARPVFPRSGLHEAPAEARGEAVPGDGDPDAEAGRRGPRRRRGVRARVGARQFVQGWRHPRPSLSADAARDPSISRCALRRGSVRGACAWPDWRGLWGGLFVGVGPGWGAGGGAPPPPTPPPGQAAVERVGPRGDRRARHRQKRASSTAARAPCAQHAVNARWARFAALRAACASSSVATSPPPSSAARVVASASERMRTRLLADKGPDARKVSARHSTPRMRRSGARRCKRPHGGLSRRAAAPTVGRASSSPSAWGSSDSRDAVARVRSRPA